MVGNDMKNLFQDEKMFMESTKVSIIQQNEILQQELDLTREKLDILLKSHGELESKSKSDLKRLIKEVKSLRSCQLELKDEVSRLMKEKLEGEVKFSCPSLLLNILDKSLILHSFISLTAYNF